MSKVKLISIIYAIGIIIGALFFVGNGAAETSFIKNYWCFYMDNHIFNRIIFC